MENSGFHVVGSDRCGNLRWKGLYIDPEQETSGEGEHIFWCLKTQLGLGPDGKFVDKYDCNSARNCYQAL
jgi:hypothetical protein